MNQQVFIMNEWTKLDINMKGRWNYVIDKLFS